MSRRSFIIQSLIVDTCTRVISVGNKLVAAQSRTLDRAMTVLRHRVIRMARNSLASNDLSPEERRLTMELLAELHGNDMIDRVLTALKNIKPADKEEDRFAAKNSLAGFPLPEDDQGPRCPACGIPLEQAQCDCTEEEKEAAARRKLDRVKVLLTFVDGDTTWVEVEADSPLAEHQSWSVHADL